MYLLPAKKNANGKQVAETLSVLSKTPCTPAIPPCSGFFLGGCTVTPKGIISLPTSCTLDEANDLCHQLLTEGFSYYVSDQPPLTEEGSNIPVDWEADEDFTDPRLSRNDGIKYITLSMDQGTLTAYDIQKLETLVASKASLLKKTLVTDDLPIIVQNGKLFFPWFIDHGAAGELQAYLDLVDRLVCRAQRSQRIMAKDHPAANEKLQMGIFLTQLGISAREYFRSRRLLLRNLESASRDVDYLPDTPEGAKHLPAPRVYLPGQPLLSPQDSHL